MAVNLWLVCHWFVFTITVYYSWNAVLYAYNWSDETDSDTDPFLMLIRSLAVTEKLHDAPYFSEFLPNNCYFTDLYIIVTHFN